MLAGGVIGRGALAAGRGMGFAAKAPTAAELAGMTAAQRAGVAAQGARQAAAAGAVGEGAAMAGSQAEQIRQETADGLLTPTQAGMAAATGVLGAGITRLSGGLQRRLGIGDIDTMAVQGTRGMAKQFADDATTAAANPLAVQAAKSLPRQVIEGAITEGLLEELPQSVAEQVLQNLALDKPWTDGLDDAIVMGALTGGLMGAGAAGLHGYKAPKAGATGSPGVDTAGGDVPPGTPGAPPVEDAPSAPTGTPGIDRLRAEWQARMDELQQQEDGEPQVPQVAPPDGRAALAAQQAQQEQARLAQQDANRAVEGPDDEIYQSTGFAERAPVQRPSEAMGLRSGPEAGGLEDAAALAVDTGATAKLQGDAALAQAAEQVKEPNTAGAQPQAPDGVASSIFGAGWSKAAIDGMDDAQLQRALEDVRQRRAASAGGAQGQARTPDQIRRERLEREISTGKTNNGGVIASLRPSAIEKRKQARADMLRFGGDDVKPFRDMVMDAADVADAAKVLRDQLANMAREQPDRAEQFASLISGIQDRAAKVLELQDKGYAPLSRFGRYTVDVVVNGERQYFSLFETAAEANDMAAKMRAEFGAASVTQGTMSEEAFKLFAGITPESLEIFGNMLGLDSDGDKAQDKAFQEYLRLTKTNRSAMKRLIHRKGIAGYSEDVGRVLASFIYSNSRQTAAGLNMGDLGQAVSEIPQNMGELKDAAMRLAEYVKNPQEEAQAIRGLLFAQYLGGSIASAFVNMSQPVAVTFPWLSQFGGAKQAATELTRAAKQMATKGFAFEPGLARALHDAEEDGTVSPQEVHQLMAQASGRGSLKSGDGTKVGDARVAGQNALARLSVAWGKVFGAAEQVNRRMTFIAAYRVAVAQGHASPSAFAKKAVTETQFLYSKANKMRFARGAIGGTLMTFKTYSVAYLELLHRMYTQGGPEGTRSASRARCAGTREVCGEEMGLEVGCHLSVPRVGNQPAHPRRLAPQCSARMAQGEGAVIYTHIAAALVAAAIAATGAWQVQAWRHGAKEAQRLDAERVAQEARDTDARQQRAFNDAASGRHAQALAQLNSKLGDARAQIATLSRDRQCLDARTVGMLNNLGTRGLGLRTPTGESAGAPPAPAVAETDPATGYASERDAAEWIAICRTQHDALAGQLSEILDIEDRRQGGAK